MYNFNSNLKKYPYMLYVAQNPEFAIMINLQRNQNMMNGFLIRKTDENGNKILALDYIYRVQWKESGY